MNAHYGFAPKYRHAGPPEAWTYKIGNRSALEWVLDQYRVGQGQS
jgi:predicted helicase